MDSIGLILSYTDVKTIFRAKRVCKKWRDFIRSMRFAQMLPRHINHIAILIEKGSSISTQLMRSNPDITWELICATPNAPWDYGYLSANINITIDIVKANPDKKWSYRWLSANPNITWDIVKADPDKDWCYETLSENPSITGDIVQANPDIPWDYYNLTHNINITWDIIEKNLHYEWDFEYLSETLPYSIILEYPKIGWCVNGMSCNSTITWDIVLKNPDRWDYSRMSGNPIITPAIVEAYPDVEEWDPVELMHNINFTVDDIRRLYGDAYASYMNQKVKSWDMVIANPTISWDLADAVKYLPITCEIIEKIPKLADYLLIAPYNVSITHYLLKN